MFKIIVFIPISHTEKVRNALFKSGAGKLGNYDCCSFETTGTGQFRPLAGSNPYLGTENLVEKVIEIKLEIVCSKKNIKDAIKAMKQAHPYEEVAFDVIKLETSFDEGPIERIEDS
ncbi:MAG: NGG1p interacting factor NIF3 [Epsilonproteobacteria bacterium]|nr:MAG: NGG1p interacting factor NIF3 [Campylobacterota bacterium]RLA66224.1 MAG: NGG1p interacting factor NIF3 [Campylobacterota bacterium]